MIALWLTCAAIARADITVGSKAFTEGFVLGEWLAERVGESDPVATRFGMGGTGILFPALRGGDVDFYVEYTGTIAEALLHRARPTAGEMRAELANLGVVMSEPLGFRNDYALAVSEAFAERHHLRSIGDLARVTGPVRGAFSYEFVERADGLRGLVREYDLFQLRDAPAMEHALAFEAIARDRADVIDVYTTDAKIDRLRLKVLRDDRSFFPKYEAVILTRAEVAAEHPALWRRLGRLAGTLDASTVRRWNARVDLDGIPPRAAVRGDAEGRGPTLRAEVARRAREHAWLVGIALIVATLVGVPLGVLAYRWPRLGRVAVVLSGLVQTIPSLALLCFLIPITGIGARSALVALCLYGLLPIVENTRLGLTSIDAGLIEMARALRLTPIQRLIYIELPLASRAILSGVRTSAVIGIGTATLAALIGAGGFGATITSGLATNDARLIWAGALPAAVMALGVQGLFFIGAYVVIPEGLRRAARGESK